MRENDEMSTKIMLLENEAKQSREDEYEIAKQAIVDQTSTMVNLDELKAKAETRLSEANFKVKQLEEEKVFFGGAIRGGVWCFLNISKYCGQTKKYILY